MRHKKDSRLFCALAQSVPQNEVIATVSGRIPDGPGNARSEMCQLQSQAGHGGLPATEHQVPALRDAEFIEGRSEPPIRVPSSAFLSSRKAIDMTIHATTIVPIGTEYVASASGIQIPQGATYGQIQRPGTDLQTEYTVALFESPCPASIAVNDSRHTIAMDVIFTGDALSKPGSHLVLASRHKGGTYKQAGDHRSAAIIAGALWGEGVVGLEEIEIDTNRLNKHHGNSDANQLQTGRWYRMAIETVAQGGGVLLDGRVWDAFTGALIYTNPPVWSDFPTSYNIHNQRVLLSAVSFGTGGFRYSNLKSYWSNGSEWVFNP
jgi:hypothetical protein